MSDFLIPWLISQYTRKQKDPNVIVYFIFPAPMPFRSLHPFDILQTESIHLYYISRLHTSARFSSPRDLPWTRPDSEVSRQKHIWVDLVTHSHTLHIVQYDLYGRIFPAN